MSVCLDHLHLLLCVAADLRPKMGLPHLQTAATTQGFTAARLLPSLTNSSLAPHPLLGKEGERRLPLDPSGSEGEGECMRGKTE